MPDDDDDYYDDFGGGGEAGQDDADHNFGGGYGPDNEEDADIEGINVEQDRVEQATNTLSGTPTRKRHPPEEVRVTLGATSLGGNQIIEISSALSEVIRHYVPEDGNLVFTLAEVQVSHDLPQQWLGPYIMKSIYRRDGRISRGMPRGLLPYTGNGSQYQVALKRFLRMF